VSEIKKLFDSQILPQLIDKKIERRIYTEMTKIISSAYSQNIASDESFCFKFSLPLIPVNNFYKILKIDPKEVNKVIHADWGKRLTKMHTDPYYQILLLFIYYGITNKKEMFAKSALTILLMKIWNGRKSKFFKYCDKRVMKYVISHELTNRHVLSKYENPVSLLKDYFMPTILKKYGPEIDKDIFKLKRLFEQSWARVRQIFVFNARTNIRTGKSEAQGGLLPIYMKTREEGKHLSTKSIRTTGFGDEESVTGYEEYATTHNRDEIVSKTTDYIILNKSNKYSQKFVSEINKKTNVSIKIIDQILDYIHIQSNYDIIQNLIVLILSRCDINLKEDICKREFTNNIRKNIISSKNNKEINKIQRLLDHMLTKFFKEKLRSNFNKYSSVHKIKIRNVITYALEYNLVKLNCRN
jgi:hypothetical protein